MSSVTEKKTLDFLTAKETILRELGKISSEDRAQLSFPEITLEKNELKIEFILPGLTKELIFDCIHIVKNHIDNLRIHTFEPGFYSFQALNENFFDTKGILDNIRFRFYSNRTQNKLEISKKGDLNSNEVLVVITIYQFFLSAGGKKAQNPKDLLSRLGILVYDPLEEELKGNLLDFSHVAGYNQVKEEIIDSIILPLQNPTAFDDVSKFTRKFPTRNRPRAVLFEGDPGVGKTTMAKIVAFQCKIPMVYVPIETIMSKYYGESSQNLAYVFDAAALFPSALIFLDEIDSLAGNRDDGMFEATRNLLSVLLRKLDGFEGKPTTITLGATNRKQDLDRALLSRFDKSIYFPLPNLEERAAILGNYAIQLTDLERLEISAHMEGFSGRNIKDFCDHVERKWASKIIQEKLESRAPSFSQYKELSLIIGKR
jgi:AAA+ superfamily predicted ATPase